MNMIGKSYWDGRWVDQQNCEEIEVVNPGKLVQTVGIMQMTTVKTIPEVLLSAEKGFALWKDYSLNQRAELTNALIQKLEDDFEDLAYLITQENGKTLEESRSEVRGAIAESQYQWTFLKEQLTLKKEKISVFYEPIGVSLAITPWNFPLATIMRKIIPALLCGNAVIVKPSEHCPLTAVKLFESIDALDFPEGAINLVLGDGGEIGNELLKSHIIKAISFTGSTAIGQHIQKLIGGRDIRYQAEMGGSNAVLVLNDADLELASKDIISNGFACSGQWCTGTTRVIVENGVYDELLQKLIHKVSTITCGNGEEEDIDMGPLSNSTQFKRMNFVLDAARKEGELPVVGGRSNDIETEVGYFMKPTIFSNVSDDSILSTEELFGPILIVSKCENLGEGIDHINKSQFGLSASIYTSNEQRATKFVKDIDAGLVHVNLPTAYRSFDMPLLGRKNSGLGIPECGRFMLDLFTKPKVVYLR